MFFSSCAGWGTSATCLTPAWWSSCGACSSLAPTSHATPGTSSWASSSSLYASSGSRVPSPRSKQPIENLVMIEISQLESLLWSLLWWFSTWLLGFLIHDALILLYCFVIKLTLHIYIHQYLGPINFFFWRFLFEINGSSWSVWDYKSAFWYDSHSDIIVLLIDLKSPFVVCAPSFIHMILPFEDL